jgi:hypothetical protein
LTVQNYCCLKECNWHLGGCFAGKPYTQQEGIQIETVVMVVLVFAEIIARYYLWWQN